MILSKPAIMVSGLISVALASTSGGQSGLVEATAAAAVVLTVGMFLKYQTQLSEYYRTSLTELSAADRADRAIATKSFEDSLERILVEHRQAVSRLEERLSRIEEASINSSN